MPRIRQMSLLLRLKDYFSEVPFAERLIYYLLLPDVFSRVFLEFGAGIYWYSITQPKQWVLYLILMLEYLLAALRIFHMKFSIRQNIPPIILFGCMLIHGLFAGIISFNHVPKILTDSIPVLVLLVNCILLTEENAYKGLNFDRLLLVARIYAVLMISFGFAAVSIGEPSIVSLGGAAGTPLCLSILILGAAKSGNRNFLLNLFILLVVLGAVVPNINRTTLVVAGSALAVLVLPRVFTSLVGVALSVAMVAALLIVGPLLVPEDSPLARRVTGIMDSSESSSTSTEGSLGERRAEVIAIDEKLRAAGATVEWLGAGAGGTYWVEFTHGKIPENYSHAHYGWALFKLRYGYFGYFYLVCFGLILASRAIKYCTRRDSFGQLVGVICIWGIVFIFTYMFFNQLISGLQFCVPPILAAGTRPLKNQAQVLPERSGQLA